MNNQVRNLYLVIGRYLRYQTGIADDPKTALAAHDCWHTLKFAFPCSKSRDPRFENLSGKFSTDQFRKQYAFVYDEALPEEKKDLKRQLQVVHGWDLSLCHCSINVWSMMTWHDDKAGISVRLVAATVE